MVIQKRGLITYTTRNLRAISNKSNSSEGTVPLKIHLREDPKLNIVSGTRVKIFNSGS